MKPVRHLTNTHVSEQSNTLRTLYTGHEGKRDLYIGKPKAIPMVTYSQPELIKQGFLSEDQRVVFKKRKKIPNKNFNHRHSFFYHYKSNHKIQTGPCIFSPFDYLAFTR